MDIVTAQFPGVAETARYLTQEDAFTRRLSAMDIHFRTQSATANMAALGATIRNSARDWLQEDEQKVRACFAQACAILDENTRLLPPEVIFCQTNGSEEPGSAYCRGSNCIVLHPKALQRDADRLVRLLVHELFHLISRNHPALQEALYKEIGFYRGAEIELGQAYQSTIITNPDAPTRQYYFKARIDEENRNVYPLLFLAAGDDPHNFNLQFYDPTHNRLYRAEDIGNLYENIGLNTDYIIHPEEILAENFTLLLCGGEIKTPRVIRGIQHVLETARSSR